MSAVDPQAKVEYLISAGIEYYNTSTKESEISNFTIKQLQKYDISKDSTKYDYNIHLLNLAAITEIELLGIKDKNNWIIIKLQDKSGQVFSNKRFKMLVVNILQEQEQMYNIQIVMMSELPYIFAHSYKYASTSTLNTSLVTTGITAHELMSTILRRIQTDSATDKKIAAHWNVWGKLNQFYPSIRIPETFTDIELFRYIFKTYPPYIFEPYFIFDDFHIPKIKQNVPNAPYNIIVNNLFNITSAYEKISVKSLPRITPSSKLFVSSIPLIDHDNLYKLLRSTIILNNGNVNKVEQIKPVLKSDSDYAGNIVKNIDSTLDAKVYIKQLEAKKILVDKNSSMESYTYKDIDITDISFLSVYNIADNKVYDHLPLTIEYSFLKNQYNSFWVTVHAQYAKVPEKLY